MFFSLSIQDGVLSQHASLLPGDPLLLQQHSSIPVSIAAAQGVANLAIPANAMHIETNQQNHNQMTSDNQSENQQQQQQSQQQINQMSTNNTQQTNMVQVQVIINKTENVLLELVIIEFLCRYKII